MIFTAKRIERESVSVYGFDDAVFCGYDGHEYAPRRIVRTLAGDK